MKFLPDIRYAAPEECLLDLFLPEDTDGNGYGNFLTVIMMHGGGLVNGSRKGDGIRKIAEALSRYGIATISPEYRMFPTAKYPEFIQDAASCAAWVKNNIVSYGGNGRMYIGGLSAGAYLSMMLCFDPQWLAAVGMKPLDVSGYLHGSAQPTKHFNVLKYSGIDSRRVIIDETAPIWHITEDMVVPPMQILASDHDVENRLNQNRLLVSTMQHFGHDMSRVDFRELHGTHCSFAKEVDAFGNPVYAGLILDFMRRFCGEKV